jgi:hypothetical protein
MFAAAAAFAQDSAPTITLLPGHPVYHESEREAGVTMAVSINLNAAPASVGSLLCEELRRAAGLTNKNEDDLHLETIFVVPRKQMAIEGYYWAKDGTSQRSILVAGHHVVRTALDSILARAGIPPHVLDETNVEHEISCEIAKPHWYIAWSDVQPIGDAMPETVIELARHRFMTIHRAVVDHNS